MGEAFIIDIFTHMNGSNLAGKPFLKWAGGKTQLLQELRKNIPSQYGKYIEPFAGGGALFFHLAPKNAVISDSNEELINAYRVVKQYVNALIKELGKFKNEEAYYYDVRAKDVAELSRVERAARLIYLNKTCYNGLYRVNKKGLFNVPFGKRVNPTICDESSLREASRILKGVEIQHGDYLKVLQRTARAEDFIFLDPPYVPVGEYSDFKRYTKNFFYEEDHLKLKDEIDRLVDLGCYVLITNSDADLILNLYKDYDYRVVNTKRLISSNPLTRTGKDLIALGGF